MTPKRLEDFTQTLRWNRGPGIPHLEHQGLPIVTGGESDGTIGQSMGQGICQKIGGDLLQPSQIAPHRSADTDIGKNLAIRLRIAQLLNHGVQTDVDILHLG